MAIFNLPDGAFVTCELLGDSITEAGVPAGTNPSDITKNTGYRYPLWVRARAAGINIAYVGGRATNHDSDVPPTACMHDGVTGEKVAQIMTRVILRKWQAPNVILLHWGTNDINVDGTDGATLAATVNTNLTTIWEYGRRGGNNQLQLIELALIPQSPNHNVQVAPYNAALVTYAAAQRAAGVNVHTVDMNTEMGPVDGPLWQGSGQPHPNALGYYSIYAKNWFGTPGSGLLADYAP